VPFLERPDGTSIYFEERGSGPPLLAIAPGGMRSTIDYWKNAAIDPWAAFTDEFRVVAMDQRNAGRSTGPLPTADPWGAYARDQLAVLDHLGVDRFLVLGCCIGGSFVLKLAKEAPGRVVAGVLEQPIGVVPANRELFAGLQSSWAEEIAAGGGHPDHTGPKLEEFLAAMWAREFAVSVEPEDIRAIRTPLLVLPGIDDYHPTEAGREIAGLAPNAEVLEPWKDDPRLVAEATQRVREWLKAHATEAAM
jgi:pimeloyl-ACP methyl ester carboxylesterase